MAAPIFKGVTKNHNYTTRAPSLRNRFNVVEEDQPAPLKIVGGDPSSHPCLSLQKKGSLAVIKAKEFQSSLEKDFPSCYKIMVPSYVTSGCSLGLPKDFCKSFLPKKSNHVNFVLEDENEDQWEVRYFAYMFRISAGWRDYVLEHHLVEGDVLVFQLVKPTKFKVYIIKANNGNEFDGSTTHFQPPRLLCAPSSDYTMALEYSCDYSAYSFQEVKTFEDFHIVVNGLCVDHELPDDIRSGYYKLCFQEKEFLHNGIPEHHSSTFVVGMIGETVNISVKIKNCWFITTTKEEVDKWDNTLEAFEVLGMEVKFLRDRIRTLGTIMFDSVDIKKYMEAVNELKLIEGEIPRVASEIRKLKQMANKLEANLCASKQKAEEYKNSWSMHHGSLCQKQF